MRGVWRSRLPRDQRPRKNALWSSHNDKIRFLQVTQMDGENVCQGRIALEEMSAAECAGRVLGASEMAPLFILTPQ